MDAPTGFVRMHDGRIGQQRAQCFEFRLPFSRQLIQQRIDLRFRKFQVLKEIHQGTNFVER